MPFKRVYLLKCRSFSGLVSKPSLAVDPDPAPPNYDHEKHKSILYTMACCHSLKVVDGEILGDPLEVKMFLFTGWSYEEGESRALEQSNSQHGTIAPSVAKPPVGCRIDGYDHIHVRRYLLISVTRK